MSQTSTPAPEVLLAAIQAWQANPHVHPLTCGNNSFHSVLSPVLEEGRVVLTCADCHYRQEGASLAWMVGLAPVSPAPTVCRREVSSGGRWMECALPYGHEGDHDPFPRSAPAPVSPPSGSAGDVRAGSRTTDARDASPCAVCGFDCGSPLAQPAAGAHLWFIPRLHGYPNISGDDESCAKCSKMRGPVNESRPCPGPTTMTAEAWFR